MPHNLLIYGIRSTACEQLFLLIARVPYFGFAKKIEVIIGFSIWYDFSAALFLFGYCCPDAFTFLEDEKERKRVFAWLFLRVMWMYHSRAHKLIIINTDLTWESNRWHRDFVLGRTFGQTYTKITRLNIIFFLSWFYLIMTSMIYSVCSRFHERWNVPNESIFFKTNTQGEIQLRPDK